MQKKLIILIAAVLFATVKLQATTWDEPWAEQIIKGASTLRHMMYISLSYDHRIIDGALGSTFLNAVSKELENFDGNRSI